jgi:flagellar motor switch protein FliM
MIFQDQAAISGLSPAELAALLGPQASVAMPTTPVATYDSLSPEWRTVGEVFARALAMRLRPQIRAAVRVTVLAATRTTAECVTTAGDAQAVIQFFQCRASLEPLALVLSSGLVTTFLDRMLGGRATPADKAPERSRTLTDVDHRIARRLLNAAQASLEELTGSDATQLAVTPSDAQTVAEAWLPEQPLVRLTLELQFAQGGGHLDLLLPQEIGDWLMTPGVTTDGPHSEEPVPADSSGAGEPPKPSLIIAELAQVRLSPADFAGLSVGDVLLTDTLPGDGLRVFVDGQLRFQAVGGEMSGRKAIRLTQDWSRSH